MGVEQSISQVLVMMVLMAFGWLAVKAHLVSLTAEKSLTNIVLYFVCPAVIIQAFQRPFDPAQLRTVGWLFVIDLVIFAVWAVLAHVVFRRVRDENTRIGLEFGTIYQNCGFMGLPLAQALFGADGVVYATVFVALMNLTVWTHGDMMLAGPKRTDIARGLLEAAKAPALIATVVAIILFATGVRIPSPLSDVVAHTAAMNAPLSMFAIGMTLASVKLTAFARGPHVWLGTLVRNVLMPALVVVALAYLPLDPTAKYGTLIAAACPVAPFLIMFSVRHNRDTDFAVRLLCCSTIVSIVTLPAILAAARAWWGV